jgi:hypothetical protein
MINKPSTKYHYVNELVRIYYSDNDPKIDNNIFIEEVVGNKWIVLKEYNSLRDMYALLNSLHDANQIGFKIYVRSIKSAKKTFRDDELSCRTMGYE